MEELRMQLEKQQIELLEQRIKELENNLLKAVKVYPPFKGDAKSMEKMFGFSDDQADDLNSFVKFKLFKNRGDLTALLTDLEYEFKQGNIDHRALMFQCLLVGKMV
jgi:hypothetical protein